MHRQILTVVTVMVLALTSPLAMAEDMVGPAFSDSFGFGFEEPGTSAYLGVDITAVTPDRVSALKLKEEEGVEVLLVDQDSPAGKAGLKEHDVILTLNGVPVESGAQLRRMIHETPPGRTVTLGVSRDGQMQTIKAQLAERRKALLWKESGKDGEAQFPAIPPIPNFSEMEIPNVVVVHSSMRSGLMVENLTPQLGDFFGVKGSNGVLVRSVEKGSIAAKAGLRAGDVIVRVDGEAVTDVSDFSHALRSHHGGKVSVGVIRDKREQTISLPVMERKQSGMLEESWGAPELDVDADIDLSEITMKIAELEPPLHLAAQSARQAMEKGAKAARKSLREHPTRMKLELSVPERDMI